MAEDQDDADYHAVVDLYGDWAERRISVERPLSDHERFGLLIVDLAIRHDMGAWDSFVDDVDEALETAEALRTVGLSDLADRVHKAADLADWNDRENAFRAIKLADIEILYVAVAKYLRKITS